MVNAQDFHTYLVKLAMEAYDAADPGHDSWQRVLFEKEIVARMATVTVPDRLPSVEEEAEMEAHEASLRVFEASGEGACGCMGDDMDGDHASALESVYGPEND